MIENDCPHQRGAWIVKCWREELPGRRRAYRRGRVELSEEKDAKGGFTILRMRRLFVKRWRTLKKPRRVHMYNTI